MISTKEEYVNTKTLMNVKCDKGHFVKTSYNRFISGHGCKECARGKQRKHNIDAIKQEFIKKGFELLEDTYINNDTNMKYKCKCGRERHITYKNFTKNIDGCNECTRRWTIDDVIEYMEDQGCVFIKSDSDEFILNASTVTFSCYCGNEKSSCLWKSFKKGTRCKDCVKEQIKQTSTEVYGYANPAQSPIIKQLTKENNKKKFGVDHHMKLDKYKNMAKETNMKNNGGIHNLNLSETRALALSPESIAKTNETNMKKYNSPWYLKSQAYKDTMMKNHGVKHPLHLPEFLAQQQRSSYSRKEYTTSSGNVLEVQGYEPFALDDIFNKGVHGKYMDEKDVITGVENVPIIDYLFDDKESKYYPDIYIPSHNMIIEIKSTYTYEKYKERNNAKLKACQQKGYETECWIYNAKAQMIKRLVYLSDIILSWNFDL